MRIRTVTTDGRRVERSAFLAFVPVIAMAPFCVLALFLAWLPVGLVTDVPFLWVLLGFAVTGPLLFVRPFQVFVLTPVLGARRPTDEEAARIEPLWNEILRLSDVDDGHYVVRVLPSDELNAYACGGHLVVVTSFALGELSDPELQGVLAHEVSHHLGLHTVAITIGHWLSTPVVALARVGVFLENVAIAARESFGRDSVFIDGITNLTAWVIRALSLVFTIGIRSGTALGNLVGHGSEFDADRRAVRMGFGRELASALRRVLAAGQSPPAGRMARAPRCVASVGSTPGGSDRSAASSPRRLSGDDESRRRDGLVLELDHGSTRQDSPSIEHLFVLSRFSWYDLFMQRMPWWNDADEVFDDIAGHLNVLHGRMVATARWLIDNPTEWQGDGVWTPEAYICWRTGVSRSTAKQIVDIARRTADLPETIATMQRGELSLDQVAPIARHAPGWADEQVSRLAPQLMVTQISRVVRSYTWATDERSLDPRSAFDSGHEPTVDDSSCTSAGHEAGRPAAAVEPDDRAGYWWGDDGRFRLSLDVGADTGNLLETALEECHDRLFHERTDTDSVGVVDAVMEMAARSVESVPATARPSRFRTNIHLDASTGQVTDRRGRPIAVGPARRMTCDTLVSPVRVVDGVPVSVGRSQHIVPDRTRRLVEHRDGGCRVPGCHSDRFVEVHHIVHWSHGGRTDTSNLLSLCPKHHRLHHQGKLDIVGDADRPPGGAGAVEFRDRHGCPIRPSGASPNPPTEPPPPLEGTYRHPLGERLDARDLHFHEPTASRS